MQASKLYRKLEKDFITPELSDDWARHMDSVKEFLSSNFKQRSMGLVCDFAEKIKTVYTAVFPSKKVMNEIINDGAENAMLFVHHPSIWDIRNAPDVFSQMEPKLLKEFKKRKIAIYNLHAPLDNFGKYSTGCSLAKALGLTNLNYFEPYNGGYAGVVGKTKLKTIKQLKKVFDYKLGHASKLYSYGSGKIENNRVAIVAGGGNSVSTLENALKQRANVFLTGVSAKNDYSKQAHGFAKKNKINILGGTHYSTEKFACIKMCGYFRKLGLPSRFIDDLPVMEDM